MTSSQTEAPPGQRPWHALPPEAVLEAVGSSSDGLSENEARTRLERHGANVLQRVSGESPLKLLWRQVNSPLIWVLLASATLAISLGKVTDGLIVLAVVVLNTLIGFVQEFRAGKAIEALTQMVPENATTLREGQKVTVPSARLVPGDVVLLASGDKVPADVRLLAARNFQVEEAALTGESLPSEKRVAPVEADAGLGDRTSMAFGGTHVTYGTATAVVVATAGATELGRISQLLHETVDLQTPLTKALAVIGRFAVLNRMVSPLISLLKPVSPLAWLPIGLLVFKSANPAAIWTIFICSIWPMVINTAVGVQKVPQDYLNVARVLNLSEWRIATRILLPSVMPYLLTGVRLSVGTAWLVIVAAEMLTGGVGIGFWVWDEWNNLNVAHILIAIFVIGFVGLLLEWALMAVARRFDHGA